LSKLQLARDLNVATGREKQLQFRKQQLQVGNNSYKLEKTTTSRKQQLQIRNSNHKSETTTTSQ
jgi:hypothetical protein